MFAISCAGHMCMDRRAIGCVPLVVLVYIQTVLSVVNNALYSTSDG